ncbi:type IV pilus twitching motility protein PilT [Ureibacillus thermosphaericus]|jgi:twitching motility protein PilT|uniref:type IV pilus twitching motility protein PilT n=1 Tax=Ureibacillus thermosphaericus TaxID=51173 RepID=UPI000BBCBC8B|nr:type IV pilus twitching motility protein PilT [Ureibacillus thermosphaericus]
MGYSIQDLLQKTYELNASDLHITVGTPPVYRIHGQLERFGDSELIAEEIIDMVNAIIPDNKLEEYRSKGDADFNYAFNENFRFRVNAYHQRNAPALAFRLIPTKIPTIESLGMPKVLYDLADKPQGLVLVTGPTGSGKSSTLAAMIHHINETKAKHIITLEDPIEFIHQHNQSIVNQREIGIDAKDFATGLRAALRQDPDVILVGEMRDLETISTAITAAETGHLVFGTLHTSSAPTTIDRIIDVFPPHQQNQIRNQLANVLQGVISQRLFVRKDRSGRVAATEILVAVPSVTNLIRNEKIHQIQNIMQTSRALGMHTLQHSIQELLSRGIVSFEEVKPYMNVGDYH